MWSSFASKKTRSTDFSGSAHFHYILIIKTMKNKVQSNFFAIYEINNIRVVASIQKHHSGIIHTFLKKYIEYF